MYDNKWGSYVNCLGVRDRGTSDLCTLSDCFFAKSLTSTLLSNTASFRGLGIGTFLVWCLQVLGSLGYKPPIVAMSDPFHLCYKMGHNHHMTHHVYLQLCLKMGSPYVSYDSPTFSLVMVYFVVPGYHKDWPIRQTIQGHQGYCMHNKFLCLLVLKKWLSNVHPTDELKLTTALLPLMLGTQLAY